MSESSLPKLTVVLGTRNRLPMLQRCLEALFSENGIPLRIVVADAGSTDGSLEYLRGEGRVTLVEDGAPIGQAQSLNRIFSTVTTPYTCWISDDNVVRPGSLRTAVAILDANADMGMVALKVRDAIGPHSAAPYIGATSPAGVITCNQGVVRTSLLRHIGGFDESFRNYGIDADLTVRVLLEGFAVAMSREVAIDHYRDYDAAPGAISADERRRRQEMARSSYRSKYAALLRRTPREWIRSVLRRGLWAVVLRPLTKWLRLNPLGLDATDWHNVLFARFISLSDVVRHSRTPYYLVQRIPEPIRVRAELPPGTVES